MVQRLFLVVLLVVLAAPASAPAATAWLPPVPVSPAGADVGELGFDVAMSQDGDALAVWVRGNGVVSSFRPAGGTFGEMVTVPLGAGATGAMRARVAFDGRTAVILAVQTGGTAPGVARVVRAADGSFGDAKTISTPGRAVVDVDLAGNAAGDIVAAWQETAPGPIREVAATVRPSGADFAPITTYPSALTNVDSAIANDGGAAVVWSSGTSITMATRPSGGGFGAATPVVTTAEALSEPTVAVGDGGRTVVAWFRADPTVTDDPKRRAWATVRPSGAEPFGTPKDLSFDNRAAWYVEAAVDRDGAAIVALMQGFWPLAAVAPPGGAFGPTVRLSPSAHNVLHAVRVAAGADGTTHAVWIGSGLLRHAVRPPGGTFGEMQTPSADIASSRVSDLAVDGDGNALAAWRRTAGDDDILMVSGYDAAPPQLRSLSPARSGFVGTALPFSVDAVDVWSPVSIGWEFGDGATADGAQVAHAYGAPGTYGASVTATDALGNAAIGTGTVTIAPAPVPVPGRPPITADRTAPTLSALKLSPVRFRAAGRGASLAATAVGTTVRFTLSEAASVRFTAQRATAGRRVGGSCRKSTAANRRRARCTRYVAVKGSATRRSVGGANRVKFRGRLGGRRLVPGRYRLLLRATDVAGNASAVRRVSFRVVRR